MGAEASAGAWAWEQRQVQALGHGSRALCKPIMQRQSQSNDAKTIIHQQAHALVLID